MTCHILTIISVFSSSLDFRNAFNLYDRDGRGRVAVRELGTVLRALGLNPTEGQVQQLARESLGQLFNIRMALFCSSAKYYTCNGQFWVRI